MDTGGSSESGLEEIVVTANRIEHDRNSAMFAMSAGSAGGVQGPGDVPIRTLFVEAAYFNPNSITSDNGESEIKFTVPDNLGKWRVVVIGADTKGQIFSNTHAFDVVLPLEVRAQ